MFVVTGPGRGRSRNETSNVCGNKAGQGEVEKRLHERRRNACEVLLKIPPDAQANAILADVETRLNDSAAGAGSLAIFVTFVLIEAKKR